MCLHGRSFSVEGIVLWANKFGSWLGAREARVGACEAALDRSSEDRRSELLRKSQTDALERHSAAVGSRDWCCTQWVVVAAGQVRSSKAELVGYEFRADIVHHHVTGR
jgi:hypothetical protein